MRLIVLLQSRSPSCRFKRIKPFSLSLSHASLLNQPWIYNITKQCDLPHGRTYVASKPAVEYVLDLEDLGERAFSLSLFIFPALSLLLSLSVLSNLCFHLPLGGCYSSIRTCSSSRHWDEQSNKQLSLFVPIATKRNSPNDSLSN